MIGWEKMLNHDFQNYQKNVEYEREYDKEVKSVL